MGGVYGHGFWADSLTHRRTPSKSARRTRKSVNRRSSHRARRRGRRRSLEAVGRVGDSGLVGGVVRLRVGEGNMGVGARGYRKSWWYGLEGIRVPEVVGLIAVNQNYMYMQIDDQRMRATAHNQKYERQCKAKDDRCAPSPGLQSERSNGTRDGDFHIETNKFQAQFYWRRVWFIVACPDAGVRRIECLILSVHRLVHFEDMESSLRYAFTDTGTLRALHLRASAEITH